MGLQRRLWSTDRNIPLRYESLQLQLWYTYRYISLRYASLQQQLWSTYIYISFIGIRTLCLKMFFLVFVFFLVFGDVHIVCCNGVAMGRL